MFDKILQYHHPAKWHIKLSITGGEEGKKTSEIHQRWVGTTHHEPGEDLDIRQMQK